MIAFKRHSSIFTLYSEQKLPITIDQAWEFFSSPDNLAKITPAEMSFKVTSGESAAMYPGQIITYKIGILPLFTMNWVTEITHVEHRKYFVDEQRFGPYSMWHHEHIFEETDGGVLIKDKVSYKIPLGLIGVILEKMFIRRQLRGIFSYRGEVLEKMFG